MSAEPRPASSSPGSSTDSECSFYLHNPRDVIYNRVKDLFEVSSQARPDSPATRSGSAASSVCSSAEGSTTVVVGPAGAVTGKILKKC